MDRASAIFDDLKMVYCNFCATPVPAFDSLSLESCQHTFCNDCIKGYVNNSKDPQIPCPIQGEQGGCNGFLTDPEIKNLVSERTFQKYLARSLRAAFEADNQLSRCFVKDCPGICQIDAGITYFYCPVCNALNCTTCKSTHEKPCKRPDPTGNGLDDLDKIDARVQVAMKFAPPETEEEKRVRMEWEASWEQLRAKVNAPTNGRASLTAATAGEGAGGPLGDDANTQMKVFKQLLLTDQTFECSICLVEVGQGVILQECFHRFCRECLASTIEHSEEPHVMCPYQSGNHSCQFPLLDREVKALVSHEIYEKRLKKFLSTAEMGMTNAFHCQSVNCTGWVEVEAEQVAGWTCFICEKQNCVPCKSIHETITCADYQNRLKQAEHDEASKEALKTLVEKGEAMNCPTCKVVIIKNGGCDGMLCVVCRTDICWATKGPRWGPQGRGDTSGGCRCRFAGRLCHPNCQNCH